MVYAPPSPEALAPSAEPAAAVEEAEEAEESPPAARRRRQSNRDVVADWVDTKTRVGGSCKSPSPSSGEICNKLVPPWDYIVVETSEKCVHPPLRFTSEVERCFSAVPGRSSMHSACVREKIARTSSDSVPPSARTNTETRCSSHLGGVGVRQVLVGGAGLHVQKIGGGRQGAQRVVETEREVGTAHQRRLAHRVNLRLPTFAGRACRLGLGLGRRRRRRRLWHIARRRIARCGLRGCGEQEQAVAEALDGVFQRESAEAGTNALGPGVVLWLQHALRPGASCTSPRAWPCLFVNNTDVRYSPLAPGGGGE